MGETADTLSHPEVKDPSRPGGQEMTESVNIFNKVVCLHVHTRMCVFGDGWRWSGTLAWKTVEEMMNTGRQKR